jgi:hypothetical protein
MFELNGICILCCKNKRNVCFMKLLQYILLLPPGAPVKIENLPFKRKAVNDILDDPKPEKYRKMEGYTDFVRNAMVN